MNVRYGKNKRKAISPVLATVILIAITLIAAIAIAGFVFGLFGSFTSTAQVSVTQTSIPANPATGHWYTVGTITASNTGTSNAAVNAISMTFGGATCTPVATLGSVTAGSSLVIPLTAVGTCTATPTAGEQFTGSLALSNGGSAQFTGTFQ